MNLSLLADPQSGQTGWILAVALAEFLIL